MNAVRFERTHAVPVVYCVMDHERQAVKIGFSRNAPRRLKQLQTAAAHSLTLYGVLPGDRALESAFHEYFAARRLSGEWFDDRDHAVSALFSRMAWEAAVA